VHRAAPQDLLVMSNPGAQRHPTRCFVSQSSIAPVIPYGSLLIGFLIFISCFGVKQSFAVERSLGSAGPPLAYGIEGTSIRLTRYSGSRASSPKRVVLSGRGSARLEQDGKSEHFSYPKRNFLAHLNELYRIRFFELPADYTARYTVAFRDDRTVETAALPMADIASTRICFAVDKYEKCITFSDQSPCELKDIATQIFSEAGRLKSER
jgi:hypothetical protein